MGDFPYIAGKKASQATQSHFLSNDSKVGINICAGESSLPSDYIGQTTNSLSGLSHYIMVTPHVTGFF